MTTRKLILKMSMSLDGFVGGPNGELDWLFRNSDPESVAWTVASIASASLHAMGRRTYADMAAYWPTATGPFAEPMNRIPKVVFSRGAGGPLTTTRAVEDARAQEVGRAAAADPAVVASWRDARILTGDLADEIARLKAEGGGDIVAHGGASFARALIATGLVDEYRLLVHPVALGRGLPIFERPLDLALVETRSFPKGVVAHVYQGRASASVS